MTVHQGMRAAVALAIAALACSQHHVNAPSAARAREGRTSVRLLPAPEPAATPERSEQSTETMTPAYASSENKLPEYPADALQAACSEGTVPVRVYVGPDGNVKTQKDIPDRPVATDACHVAFLAAVETAVAAWKFAPAFRQKQVAVPDSGGRTHFHWEQAPVTIYLDFEFRFEVINGKGVVRTH